MTLSSYPAGLPCPSSVRWAAPERRALITPDAPIDAAAWSRARRADEAVEIGPLNRRQADILREWWEVTLVYGAGWFTAEWPTPSGRVERRRKFEGPLSWSFVPAKRGGFWVVTAVCQSIEVPPEGELWLEDFDQGLTPYNRLNTGQDGFSIVSTPVWSGTQALQLAQIGSATSIAYRRAVDFPIEARRCTAMVMLQGTAIDDSMTMSITDTDTDNVVAIIFSREPGLDPTGLGRMLGLFGSGFDQVWMTDARLTVGVWHKVTINFRDDADATIYEVRRMDTGAVLKTGNVPGSAPPAIITNLTFSSDSQGGVYNPTPTVVDYITLLG